MFNNTLIRLWAATNLRLDNQTERGAGLVEYAMLIGLIVLVCIGAVTILGGQTETPYSEISSGIGG